MAMEEGTTTTVNFPQGMNPWGMGWNHPWQKYGMSGSALGIGIAGLVAGGLALLGARLGNGFGTNGNGCGPQYATTRDLDYERALTERDAKIGKLESQLYTDQQVNAVRQEIQAGNAAQARLNDGVMASIATLQQQAAAFDAMQMSVLKPSVLAPSQAVLAQFQAAKAATPAAAGGTNSGSGTGS